MNNNASSTEARVLIIDDMVTIHEDFRKILRATHAPAASLAAAHVRLFGASAPTVSPYRFELDCVTRGQEGVARVEHALADGAPFALAFVDMRMPGWDGIETTRHLWEKDPALQVVICTAYSDHTWEDITRLLGKTENLLILKKPFDNIEVLQMAHALAAKWSIQRQHQRHLADLDERVQTQRSQLRQAEGRFACMFHASPLATTLQDASDARYLDANPAFLALVGRQYDEIVPHTAATLDVWPDGTLWTRALSSLRNDTRLRSVETTLRRSDGSIRNVLVHVEQVAIGTQQCIVTIIDDVTDRLLLERKFQQAQKMEVVGQLAAGIAHDFNNLLTVIQSYSALLLLDPKLSSDHRTGAEQIRAAADRAAALTRQLLVFTRRQIVKSEPVDFGSLLVGLERMLHRLLPEHIAFNCEWAPSLPLVLGDQPNLEQVVVNLVVNARDAMPNGGQLTCSATRVAIDEQTAPKHPEGRVGNFVRLTVTDTGIGIPSDVLTHIFEPFFTTKEPGKGTGLGLSTVYAIVRQHAGWIEVASEPGRGTSFDLYFPEHATSLSSNPSSNSAPAVRGVRHGNGERILLVEDEASVRLAASTIARRAGYEVIEAVDAEDAMRVWTQHGGKFSLLLTDMVMPNGRNGAELASLLRRQNPNIKILIATGYSKEMLDESYGSPRGARVILKPFTNEEILTAIREALDAKADTVAVS